MRTNRTATLACLTTLVFVVFAGNVCRAKVAQPRPNVIVIIGDDISAADWGCYGHPTLKTPNVDRLASEGRRFANAFLTISSCSPSRCSIVTGRYPHNTGAPELHSRLPDNQTTFPMLLKQAAYYTAAVGKWHMGEAACIAKAFDVRTDSRPSGAEKWVKTLQNREKDKPFFMWFASYDAHRQWDGRMPFETFDPKKVVVPPYLADTPETRKDLAKYYDEVRRLDHYVGKVREELERQKVAEQTLIFVLADNGRPFPRCKTRVYDSGMQTPLVAWWPRGIKQPGAASEGLVSSIDIAATILEVAGVTIPKTVQGRSFAKMFEDPKAETCKYVFSEHNWHDFSAFERQVRTQRFMYVKNSLPEYPNSGPADSLRSPSHKALVALHKKEKLTDAQRDSFIAPRPKEELFDVVADPHQLKNLADDPAYATQLKELRSVLATWSEQTADSIPTKPRASSFNLQGKRVGAHPRPAPGQEFPGTARGASKENAPGPR